MKLEKKQGGKSRKHKLKLLTNIFYVSAIIAICGHIFIAKNILNSPIEIWYLYIVLAVLLFILKKDLILGDSSLVGIFYYLVYSIIVFYAFVFIPFTGILKYTNNKKDCSVYECEIIGVTTSQRNRSIMYKFKNDTYKFYNYQPYPGFVIEEKDVDKYYVELVACEGILNSFRKKSLKLREK